MRHPDTLRIPETKNITGELSTYFKFMLKLRPSRVKVASKLKQRKIRY